MAKFMVKKSELKNVCKSVNERKLAELKKEIIEILKKQDEKEFKKATDYLNSQEEHFTHLEKSLSGKWIEKAGYGIGTVRVWKGKKYKKIAPNKWVRVFDKEGRGTNVSIGKLISRVQKCKSVEELMALAMANKSRFVDENGNDLPILDKLRAEIDIKNETLSGESSSYTYGVGENVSREKNKLFEGKDRITKEEADLHKVARKFSQMPTTELKQRKAKLERWIENKTRNKRDSLNNAIFRESYQKELDAINEVLDKRNEKKKEIQKLIENAKNAQQKYLDLKKQYKGTGDGKDEINRAVSVRDSSIEKIAQLLNKKVSDLNIPDILGESYNKETSKPAETKKETSSDETLESKKKQLDKLNTRLSDLKSKDAELTSKNRGNWGDGMRLSKLPSNKAWEKNREKIADVESEIKKIEQEISEEENKPYWIQDSRGNRLTNEDAKERIKANLEKIDNLNKGDEPRKDIKIRDLKNENNYFLERLNDNDKENIHIWEKLYAPNESKSEKKQEVYKKEYEESIKNAVNKFAEILKEENISSKEELENIKKVQEIRIKSEKEQEESDGSKGRIRIAEEKIKFINQRIKEIEEKETEAEKHQNRSEAMKGNKNAYKGGAKEVVGIFSKVDDKTVEMPLTKDAKKLFESLNKTRSNDKHRQFMADAYYDGENLVSTDGRRLTVIKAGDIGLEKGYVNVKSDNGKITVEHNAEKTKENQFPNYSKVIPDNNNQEVNLNKKDLLNKLKEMKQDGAYTKNEPSITLEFNDGNVILDGTVIGKSDAEFEGENKYIRINAEYLKDAVSSSDNSTMFVSDNPEKAISFSDNNSDIIVMPMNNSEKDNYKERRNSKKERDDWESEQKKQHQDAMNSIVDTQKESMSDAWVQNLINRVNNKEMDNHKAIIEHSYNALKEAEKMIDKPTKKWTSSLTNNKYGFSLLAATRKNPEFKTALENMANEYGLIKKSLFDDFVIDNFIEEDIDDMEEEKEEESLWNDYSAEQPELFNSVELQVCEAMNRRFGNCL